LFFSPKNKAGFSIRVRTIRVIRSYFQASERNEKTKFSLFRASAGNKLLGLFVTFVS